MINIESRLERLPVAKDVIEKAGSAALAQRARSGELTVVLTSDAQLRELNLRYLGIDAPTDVLSFPSSEIDPETRASYLGDVLISVPRAEAQARAAGHPLEAEVQLLVVHGVLHLLGYDHQHAADKARMWSAQAKALERLGLAGIKVSEN